MKTSNPIGKPIADIRSWKEIAPPKGAEKQWKCRRSALELARFFTGEMPSVPSALQDALALAGERLEKDFFWQPEYVTRLPGSGGGRNHDLILIGENIVMGVEAKADEPFDVTVGDWLRKGKNERSKQNRLLRINELCKIVFNKEYRAAPEAFNKVRYQLLSALAGTVIEAEKQGKGKASLLVLVFNVNGGCDPEKVKRNNADFEYFVDLLEDISHIPSASDYSGALSEKRRYRSADGVKTYVAKTTVVKTILCDEAHCAYWSDCEEKP